MTEEEVKAYKEKYLKETLLTYKQIEFDVKNSFNIIHLYNTGDIAHPNGFVDSMWMQVQCYDTKNKTAMVLPRNQDALFFNFDGIQVPINDIRIFLDGSVCITFSTYCKFENIFQASTIVPENYISYMQMIGRGLRGKETT